MNLILVYLTYQIGDGKKIYYCNSKKALNELRDQSKIHRFLINKNTIFLILIDKIVSFEMPYFLEKDDQIQLVTQMPFVHSNNEEKDKKKILGYLVEDDLTYEFYKSKIEGVLLSYLTELNYMNNMFETLIAYELKFDQTNIATRTEFKYKYFRFKKDKEINFRFLLKVENQSSTEKDLLIFEYSNSKLNYFLSPYNLNPSLNEFDEMIFIERKKEASLVLDYKVEYAVLFRQNQIQFNSSNSYILIELDDNQNIYLNRLKLEISDSYLKILIDKKINFRLDQFFDCHQPFVSSKQVKGIYYSNQNDLFYIIIDRFYIRTDDDLIDKKFRIDPQLYEDALDLKFELNQTENLEFEKLSSKWVKILGNEVYLVTFNKVFILNASNLKNGLIETENEKINKLLLNCTGQTLKIKTFIFCFNQKKYHLLNDIDNQAELNEKIEYYDIDEIFIRTNLKYDNQALHFIFNYRNDTMFVLMTRTHLFMIDYSLVNVENSKINLIDGPINKMYSLDNLLFESIYEIPPINLAEKVLIILIIILANILIITLIIRIVNRKRSEYLKSRSRNEMIYKTLSLRDSIRKSLTLKKSNSEPESKHKKPSQSKRLSKSKKSSKKKSPKVSKMLTNPSEFFNRMKRRKRSNKDVNRE